MKQPSFLLILVILFCTNGCKIKNTASGGVKAISNAEPKGQDPLYVYQWYLHNTGQKAFSGAAGTPGADINIGNLYELGINGSGVVVAVSDTNIDMDHEDLVKNANIALSRNYLNTSSLAWPGSKPISSNNTSSHGTAVMGIIGAVAENAIGGRGVAPNVRLAGFNYIDSNQSLSRKLDQAKGSSIDIFNYSYSLDTCTFSTPDSSYISQLKYGVLNQRSGKGSIYVKAAGNEYYGDVNICNSAITGTYLGNANLDQVNTYPYFILTAALTATGVLTDYSTPGANLWISASGGNDGVTAPGMISTDLPGCAKGYSFSGSSGNSFDKGLNELNSKCNYISDLQGTSFASPVVAGAIALLLQVNPALTWRDVKHILASTAVHIDPTGNNTAHPFGDDLAGHAYDHGWVQNAAGYWFHNWYGFGRLDASAAVAMAQNYVSNLGTLQETKDSLANWLYQSSALSLAIPDNSAAGVSDSINVTSNLIIEAVQISVNITHPMATDIGIEITSPNGVVSTVMNINSGIISGNMVDAQFLSNAFYGESTNGSWFIKVIDGADQDTGTLNSWKINFYGHAP